MLENDLAEFKTTGDFLSLSLSCSNPSYSFQLLDSTRCLINISIITSGVLLIEPDDLKLTDKDIVLSSGIHGNETAPVEIINELIQKILTKKLAVKQRLLFIIGNLPAIKKGIRFVDENLNNVFAKNWDYDTKLENTNLIHRSFEQQRANSLEKIVNDFYQIGLGKHSGRKRLHFDLHTAIRDSIYSKFAVYPTDDIRLIDKALLYILQKSDVNTVLFSYQTTNTFCYYTYQYCQAKALTIELGKVKPFGENNLADFEKIISVLKSLINNNYQESKKIALTTMNYFEIKQRIYKKSNDFDFSFADSTPNFSAFYLGDLLAKDGKTHYFAKENEEVILFPNKNVKIDQRALLTAKRITIKS